MHTSSASQEEVRVFFSDSETSDLKRCMRINNSRKHTGRIYYFTWFCCCAVPSVFLANKFYKNEQKLKNLNMTGVVEVRTYDQSFNCEFIFSNFTSPFSRL